MLFLLKLPSKKSVHSKLLPKESSTLEHLVLMLPETGILKLLQSMLLLHPITVLFLLLLSPYLVPLKNVMLMDKKLFKPFFVLVLRLFKLLTPVLLINTVVSVVLKVLFHLPVLEEESYKPPLLTQLTLLRLLHQLQLQFQFMSNLLLLLQKL